MLVRKRTIRPILPLVRFLGVLGGFISLSRIDKTPLMRPPRRERRAENRLAKRPRPDAMLAVEKYAFEINEAAAPCQRIAKQVFIKQHPRLRLFIQPDR